MKAAATLVVAAAIASVLIGAGALSAQSGLVQLGLTETAARNFVMAEVKAPTTGRVSAIVLTGTRAFLKLPPVARGPAATALFAWAKAYASSAPFHAAYTAHRNEMIPRTQQYPRTIDEEIATQVEEQKAGIAQMRAAAASMPPAEAAKFLQMIAEQEARIQSGELAKLLRPALEAERAGQQENIGISTAAATERYPTDPQQFVARHLRAFVAATADANFMAKTFSLTGGPDGIEFIEPADQQRDWRWQLAVIVGVEATTAARTAAKTWLDEIER